MQENKISIIVGRKSVRLLIHYKRFFLIGKIDKAMDQSLSE
jgi:hypothetical protein